MHFSKLFSLFTFSFIKRFPSQTNSKSEETPTKPENIMKSIEKGGKERGNKVIKETGLHDKNLKIDKRISWEYFPT